MKIKFNKEIYSKNIVYQSLEEWKQYIDFIKIDETHSYIHIILNEDKKSHKTISEFINYVLDLCSLEEISK